MFTTVTGAKLSRLKLELHSTRKGVLTVKEYIFNIQNLCALIEASGHQISKSKRVEVVLAGLSSDYDVVATLASFLSKQLPLRRLIDILLEYESREQRLALETSFQVNLTENIPSLFPVLVEPLHSGCSFFGG